MNQDYLLEKYFTKTLNSDEKSLFDTLMQSDENFREQVLYEQEVKKAISLNERATLKQKLKSFEIKKLKRNFRIWYAAASIVMLMGIGFWTFYTGSTNASIYENYYETYPNVVAPTVRGENKSDLKSEAFYSYDNGDYQKALADFSILYQTEKQEYSLFYKSLSLMELKRFDEALVSFEQFDLQKKATGFTPYVNWYKALTLIQLGENEKASVLLQDLARVSNPLQKMAQDVLSELN